MRVMFWGTRGSIPTPGPTTVKYGGNTPCVEVRAAGTRIVLDAGYRGYVGIEYEGERLSEPEGVRKTRDLLVRVREDLTPAY